MVLRYEYAARWSGGEILVCLVLTSPQRCQMLGVEVPWGAECRRVSVEIYRRGESSPCARVISWWHAWIRIRECVDRPHRVAWIGHKVRYVGIHAPVVSVGRMDRDDLRAVGRSYVLDNQRRAFASQAVCLGCINGRRAVNKPETQRMSAIGRQWMRCGIESPWEVGAIRIDAHRPT